MPQPATQPRPSAGQAAQVYVGAQAGQVAVSAAPAVATATIMASFIAWLAELQRHHRAWLGERLGRYGQPDAAAALLRAEIQLDQEFARNSADRLASALPQALRIADPAERERAVRQLLSDEERFARQHAEAMVARVMAGLDRAQVRQVSPLGAFWRLGHAHKHTEGCLIMAGRFWPWAVLDRVHPPRHYGCTSSLHSYADAVLEGWMRPSDVPDTRAAVRAASGVMMEGEADRLLAELDVRDRLLEQGVSEDALAGIAFKGVGDGATASLQAAE